MIFPSLIIIRVLLIQQLFKVINSYKLAQMSDQANMTAKAWIIMDFGTKQYWRGSNTMQKMQMASLTKMYTLQACLDINELFNIKPQLCWIQILQSTDSGTQSGLIVGKYLTLEHIYYGLMLPSGNDSALNLAYYYGYLLGRKQEFSQYEWKKQKYISLEGKKKYNRLYLARFMSYMNQKLIKQKLSHKDTHFENPHGMSDKLQRSTAWQIANATLVFLKNHKFSKICQTQSFKAIYSDGQTQQWQNTNILLRQGYIGVKTGYTTTAGACLCSRKVIYHNRKKYDLVIVILGCRTQEDRFTETNYLLRDFSEYLKVMY